MVLRIANEHMNMSRTCLFPASPAPTVGRGQSQTAAAASRKSNQPTRKPPRKGSHVDHPTRHHPLPPGLGRPALSRHHLQREYRRSERQGPQVRSLTPMFLRGVGVVGGVRGQAGDDLHRPVVLV